MKVSAALVALLMLTGCGWQETMTFPSPSGRAVIQIWKIGIAKGYGLRVRFVAGGLSTDIFTRRGEAIIRFVHVYWSSDESQVGIVATGFGGLLLAYDAQKRTTIPFESIREGVARSIAHTYNVPAGWDPIAWAGLRQAAQAFAKLHPEVKLSDQ